MTLLQKQYLLLQHHMVCCLFQLFQQVYSLETSVLSASALMPCQGSG